jgi:hypothetical protein
VSTRLTFKLNRVVIACGRAARTGDTRQLDRLLDQILTGKAAPLTATEQQTLRDYRAGKFNRKRGQSDKRSYHAELTHTAVKLVRRIKRERREELKIAPGKRRQWGDDPEMRIIEEVRAIMGEDCAPDAETIRDELHRSRHASQNRRKFNKLIPNTK